MDKLACLFNMQSRLQAHLGFDFDNMDDAALVAYIKEYTLHCEHELHEMIQELPFFKPWKDYRELSADERQEMFDKAAEEYVDVLHFFLNIGLALGYTETALFEQYCRKHAINYTRQEQEGYKKCVEDTDETGCTR